MQSFWDVILIHVYNIHSALSIVSSKKFFLISMPLFDLRMQLKCAVAGVVNGRGECVLMCWCWDSNKGTLQWHFCVVFVFGATFKVFTVLGLRILVFLNIGAICQDPGPQN
jgi:hypothetical protein